MIDAVITYVDGSDTSWLKKYMSKVKTPIEDNVTRYRSYDCLDLQVRLIRKFMKFVDNIFIVVDNLSQIEKYSFTKDDNVTIVTHEKIIPKRYLPCFNSCVIEMFFYNIKELKENFIYFNDDVFVVSECSEDDFFENNKPCISFKEKHIKLEDNNSIFDHNIANSCDLLRRIFPVKRDNGSYVRPSHSIIPLKKSAYTHIWMKCFKEIDKSLTRTRHRRNYNVYLFTNYEYYVRSHVNKKLPMKYYTVIVDTKNIYDDIKNDNLKSICMNDAYICDFNEWKSEFIKMLKSLYSDKEYVLVKEKKEKAIKLPNLINREDNLDINKYCNEHNICKNYKDGFSICLTAFRTEKYIEECLDSIQSQTYFKNHKNYEIILAIDHCYETLEKVKSIMSKYENLIVVMLNENVGTYVASNTAMSLAKYDWLIRFDTDDVMKPYMVETIANNLDNCDIIQYKLESFSTDGTKFKPFLDFVKGSIAFRKEVFDNYGGYRDWVCSADYEMLVRLSILRIKKLDIQLFYYRKHSLSLTKDNKTNGKSILRKQYNEFVEKEKILVDEYKIDCKTSNFIIISNKETIIVNVTTYPARDMFLHKALLHFQKQTVKPTK